LRNNLLSEIRRAPRSCRSAVVLQSSRSRRVDRAAIVRQVAEHNETRSSGTLSGREFARREGVPKSTRQDRAAALSDDRLPVDWDNALLGARRRPCHHGPLALRESKALAALNDRRSRDALARVFV
jgi:hypothetical protein